MIIFIFSLSHPFPAYFHWKWSHNGFFFNFLNFLAICLEFSNKYRVGTERNGTIIFISLFLVYFQPILAWNEFIMVFFHFFVIFLEFSFMPRVRMERNDNFYFLSFAAFSCLSSLEMKPQRYFLIFWIFCQFFGIFFHASGKNGTEG